MEMNCAYGKWINENDNVTSSVKKRSRKSRSKKRSQSHSDANAHAVMNQVYDEQTLNKPDDYKASQRQRRAGIYWDIENCNVPSGKSVVELVQRIRSLVVKNHFIENEFVVVCDSSKLDKGILNDLNDCQVTVIHVNSTSKNAADDKLKQCIQRFVDLFDSVGQPTALVLISSKTIFN